GLFLDPAPLLRLGFGGLAGFFLLPAPFLREDVVVGLQRRVVAHLAPQPLAFEKRRLHALDTGLLLFERALGEELGERLAVEACRRRAQRTLQRKAQRRLRAHQRFRAG